MVLCARLPLDWPQCFQLGVLDRTEQCCPQLLVWRFYWAWHEHFNVRLVHGILLWQPPRLTSGFISFDVIFYSPHLLSSGGQRQT